MKGSKRKWKMLCAGLAAAGVLVAGVPGEQMPVAEAMYSSVDATHHWYKTPNEQQNLFLLATKEGDIATVRDMIDSGVDVNGVYKTSLSEPYVGGGTTALYLAMKYKHRDIMQLLLEKGADPSGFYSLSGKYCSYSYAVAFQYQYYPDDGIEVFQYLINWGTDINKVEGAWNENALNYLADGIHEDELVKLAEFLLEKGIYTEEKGLNGRTPFIRAVYSSWYEMMDLLADHGANVMARDSNGHNAMEIALSKNDLNLYKHVKALMERGTQPSNYTPPAGTAISIDKPGGRTGSPAQSNAGRGATATKYADVFAKYSEASEKIYNELSEELKVDMTKPEQKKAALSKEADAIKELRKLNEKMAKEDPLKGLKGYSVGEREKFTDAFDGIREKNEAMIAYMEYCVAHPDDAQEDQLTALTQAVLTAHETQKQRVDDVLALIKN